MLVTMTIFFFLLKVICVTNVFTIFIQDLLNVTIHVSIQKIA